MERLQRICGGKEERAQIGIEVPDDMYRWMQEKGVEEVLFWLKIPLLGQESTIKECGL